MSISRVSTRSRPAAQPRATPFGARRALSLLAGLLILKVTATVVLGYRNYFPPNFNSDFLQGREQYFWGGYHWAFYTHIVSGPIVLILGVILISDRFRLRFPKWHRSLGKIQILSILFLMAPSGLWMAFYAAAGTSAVIAFTVLSILTSVSAALGWRFAVQRRFADHRRWMWRCFVLMCSAVVLRLLGGLAVVSGVHAPGFDQVASWASWMLPLAALELGRFKSRWRAGWVTLPARLQAQSTR